MAEMAERTARDPSEAPLKQAAAASGLRVRMHPFTLRFNDENVEQDIRSSCVLQARSLIGLFDLLIIAFVWKSAPHGHAFGQIMCVAASILAISFAATRTHSLLSKLWVGLWAINVVVWWALVANGTLHRLGPEESGKLAACSGVYVGLTILQHILHLDASDRILVIAMVLTVIVTSSFWRMSLGLSLVVGDAVGYVLERNLRETFLTGREREVAVREAAARSTAALELELRAAHEHSGHLESARHQQLVGVRSRATARTGSGRPKRALEARALMHAVPELEADTEADTEADAVGVAL